MTLNRKEILQLVWNSVQLRALYGWGWLQSIGVLVGFCLAAAVVSAVWSSTVGWASLPQAEQDTLVMADMLTVFSAYAILFLLLNLGAALVYVSSLALLAWWMGKSGYMPALSYPRAWRLVLVTGILPLSLVLVFGQVLMLSFALALVVMLVHGLWLRTVDIPVMPEMS